MAVMNVALSEAAPLRDDYDVVVVGSGGAGLAAALAAAVHGAGVLVVEAADRFGGSTSVSGGQVWVPGNHRARALGEVEDTVEQAREYCLHHCPDRDPVLIDAFLAAAPVMARAMEAHTPIQFAAMRSPDSFAEGPGGRVAGRNLEVSPVASGDFSPWQDWVWAPPYPAVLTNDEVTEHKLIFGGAPPMELIEPRMNASQVTLGVGLVVGLLRGCVANGVELVRKCRAIELEQRSGRVTAVVVDHGGNDRHLGDPEATHPNLGTIDTPPFFAMPVLPGVVGTKGGPSTDTNGQVLDWEGRPIAGLFAAGNAAESVIGPGILSSGMTLGLALTWGWLAGTAASSDKGEV